MQVPTYDVFAGQFGAPSARWLETVDGFGAAYALMVEIAAQKPGAYFVFCTRTSRVVASVDTPATPGKNT